MENIMQLFRGDNLVPTLIVALAAFIVGVLVELLVCKLTCGCGKGGDARRQGGVPQKPIKRHPAPADGSIEIYVGNLSYDLTEDRLRKEFEAFGKVNSARIITNRFNGKSKGFGFVHMPNADEVDAAIKALGDKDLLGRRLKCNVAKND